MGSKRVRAASAAYFGNKRIQEEALDVKFVFINRRCPLSVKLCIVFRMEMGTNVTEMIYCNEIKLSFH